MAAKKWTYAEITAHTEKSIKGFMETSLRKDDDFERRQYRNWAWGAYFSWYQLTSGWQNIGDKERLEDLTKIENYQ